MKNEERQVPQEPREHSIFIVDDDEGDRFLINKAIQQNGLKGKVEFFVDGQDMVDNLVERAKKSPLPSLILLDLNMPRLDGHEALRIVRKNDALKEIPIVIMSNSGNPDDIRESYQEGANSYFTKPFDFKDLVGLMGLMKSYWFEAAKLPLSPS